MVKMEPVNLDKQNEKIVKENDQDEADGMEQEVDSRDRVISDGLKIVNTDDPNLPNIFSLASINAIRLQYCAIMDYRPIARPS